METIAEFVKRNKITMTVDSTDSNPSLKGVEGDRKDHWKCVLKNKSQRSRLTVVFSMGVGWNGEPPSVDMVVYYLAQTASIAETGNEEGAGAETFKRMERTAERLLKFLGDDEYSTLLWSTSRK